MTATANPKPDADASKLVAIIDRPYDVAGFDEREAFQTEQVEIAYTSISDSDLAYVMVEKEVIREAALSILDHLATVESELSDLRPKYAALAEENEKLRGAMRIVLAHLQAIIKLHETASPYTLEQIKDSMYGEAKTGLNNSKATLKSDLLAKLAEGKTE